MCPVDDSIKGPVSLSDWTITSSRCKKQIFCTCILNILSKLTIMLTDFSGGSDRSHPLPFCRLKTNGLCSHLLAERQNLTVFGHQVSNTGSAHGSILACHCQCLCWRLIPLLQSSPCKAVFGDPCNHLTNHICIHCVLSPSVLRDSFLTS